MTGIGSLSRKGRETVGFILLYKGLKGAASIPTDDLIPPIRSCRNHHSLTLQIPTARIDIYKGSFFPQTIRDWNAFPDSVISSAEGANNKEAKFTSLTRARDYLPVSQVLVNECHLTCHQ